MPVTAPRLVYARQYNIGFFGLERLHPFDSRKFGRAWRMLRRELGSAHLKRVAARPPGPVSRDALLTVHADDYLRRLRGSRFVARVLEVPPLRYAPGWLADWRVLRPMRWATAGTILAASNAMRGG